MASNDTPIAAAERARTASPDDSSTPRLLCLGTTTFERAGVSRALALPFAKPVELVLRVVAAGPQGAPADRAAVAMWPSLAPREWRRALQDAMRDLDRDLELERAMLAEGALLHVNPAALRVDSLDFEAALAPLLNPFVAPTREQLDLARGLLKEYARALFLPRVEESWALVARLRIHDSALRAEKIVNY